MSGKEKFFKTAEIVLGVIGAALLILMLVLKLIGKEVTAMTYPIVGVIVLFLISDEIARSCRRKREAENAEQQQAEEAQEPETALPKDAFEFTDDAENKQP